MDFKDLTKLSGIYMIKNKINQKMYIGSAKNLRNRIREHIISLRGNYHDNDYLQKAFNKYGEINFEFKILCMVETSELIYTEQKFLDYYKSYDDVNGYNLCPIAYSRLGCRCSERAIKNMSEAKKKYFSTHPAPMKGKKHTEETLQKMRVIKRSGNNWTGRKHKESSKIKISISKTGKNNPMYGTKSPMAGKTHSLISREKIRMSNINRNKIRFMCNETGDIFYSYKEAARKYDLSGPGIKYSILHGTKMKNLYSFRNVGK